MRIMWDIASAICRLNARYQLGRFCLPSFEFGIRMELVRLMKTLNETWKKVRLGRDWCDIFPINSGLKKERKKGRCLIICHQEVSSKQTRKVET
jgi:hypothetical protein